MPSLIRRARAFRRSEHFKRLLKYASVSVIATVITQSVLFLTYHVFSLASAMECNVLATAVSAVPAYYLNRTWTWRKGGKSHIWREVAPFWLVAFTGLVLSTIAVGIAAHNADHLSHSRDVRALVVQLANLATYACIWVGRYFVFNKYLFGTRTHGRYGSYSLDGAVSETGTVAVASDVEAVPAAATGSASTPEDPARLSGRW
ncbi:MAG: GtrA family protein [Acidimicrobiales bacterium]